MTVHIERLPGSDDAFDTPGDTEVTAYCGAKAVVHENGDVDPPGWDFFVLNADDELNQIHLDSPETCAACRDAYRHRGTS